jgi:predicted SPOUT superfamily RNA methylase MTH1
MIDLEMIYKDLLNKDGLEYDKSQFNAVQILNSFRIQILQSFRKKNKQSLLRYFFSPNYLKKKNFFIMEFIYMEV